MALTLDFDAVLDGADLFRRADKQLQGQMRRAVTRDVNPWLASAIRRRAIFRQDDKIAGTARVRTGSNPAVVVGSGKKFSGGATTAQLVRVYEFGGSRESVTTYTRRSKLGRSHLVTRHTQRQIPWLIDGGRFIYPAVSDAAPMLVRAWALVLTDTYQASR